ncbi:SURF1 family cytochrome oxidase biogenesis protein [Brachybacterium alimentarium]|uniref:SURF1 family cytochrome oxidase biogenesis protein n=1 Tax=Brachybacterium alimentarium TaxID=47845 RepID=UPI003FD184FA
MTQRSALRRTLLSRDFLLAALGVLLASALCVGLGFWQFGRFEGKRDVAAVVEANYEAPPVPLDEVLPSPGAELDATDDWTPVELTGSYCTDPDCVLYVRNRQLDGDVGFWQLAPFHSDDGETLLVVRGWVGSQGDVSAPADPPAVPEGELSITARLRPAEPTLDRKIPAGQVHSVNPPQVAEQLPEEEPQLVTRAYGDLAQEDPEPSARPRALPDPDTSLGPHLSYSVQWWLFALFFPVALTLRTRRTVQELAEDDAQDGSPAAADHRPRRVPRARRPTQDEEEEDALIDDQRS